MNRNYIHLCFRRLVNNSNFSQYLQNQVVCNITITPHSRIECSTCMYTIHIQNNARTKYLMDDSFRNMFAENVLVIQRNMKLERKLTNYTLTFSSISFLPIVHIHFWDIENISLFCLCIYHFYTTMLGSMFCIKYPVNT